MQGNRFSAMMNREDDYQYFQNPHNLGSEAMQEICVQIRELWSELGKSKERIHELEMRAGIHDPNSSQMELF